MLGQQVMDTRFIHQHFDDQHMNLESIIVSEGRRKKIGGRGGGGWLGKGWKVEVGWGRVGERVKAGFF